MSDYHRYSSRAHPSFVDGAMPIIVIFFILVIALIFLICGILLELKT